MKESWHHKMFSHAPPPAPEAPLPEPDYGDAEVQFSMALKFANGQGAAQDYAQAAEWYRKAADQNHSLAQCNLGTMYASGQGVAQDTAESAMWFRRAARQGDAGAQFNLAEKCHRASMEQQAPRDAAESRIEAYKWYRLAAAQGYRNSENAYNTLSMYMSQADVTAGNERVAAFAIGKAD